ncbi:MAG: 1-phosphofructokinase family hexose kinase [Paracoccaceae bacterium]
MTTNLPILTITLNPALDISTGVGKIVPGPKLRCTEPTYDPGGGGLNVSRAIVALGGNSLALVALGGVTGKRLAALLKAEGVDFEAISAPGDTRYSMTVTEGTSGLQYRFVLPGPVWQEADQVRVFDRLASEAGRGGFAVISGSQPPGMAADFPERMAEALTGIRVVLDTSGPALVQAVTHPIPDLAVLRMDSEEAEALAGDPLESRKDTADFAQSLVRKGAAQQVIIARGADGSVLADSDKRLFSKAALVPVKSKVGAGDSFVGGYVLALAQGDAVERALARGVAAASAAVMTDPTELCRRADAERLVAECLVSAV